MTPIDRGVPDSYNQRVARRFAIFLVVGLSALTGTGIVAYREMEKRELDLVDLLTPAETRRFYSLTEIAKASARTGEYDAAVSQAEELLELAATHRGNWNYGNAIHDANSTLGFVALQRGDREGARFHLAEAGRTPGSPQLDTYGPDFFFARAMVEAGEADAVLAYLAEVQRFWEFEQGLLARWSDGIRSGGKPHLCQKDHSRDEAV